MLFDIVIYLSCYVTPNFDSMEVLCTYTELSNTQLKKREERGVSSVQAGYLKVVCF